jgi:hypothetical protein
MDSSVERRSPQYKRLIEDVIRDMQGDAVDPDDFIWEYRRDNRRTVEGLSFVTLTGERVDPDNEKGKVLFLTFFSPMCMSCREEVPCLRSTYEDLSKREDVKFLFILTRPDLIREATMFFRDCGIPPTLIVTVAEGSAYDYISTEPTVWIADRNGRIVVKLSGEPTGNEQAYRDALLQVLRASGSSDTSD